MDNQILNTLLADLIGISERLFSRQAGVPVEDPTMFFGILSQKMLGFDILTAASQDIPQVVNETGDVSIQPNVVAEAFAWQKINAAGLMTVELTDTLASIFGEDVPDKVCPEEDQDNAIADKAEQPDQNGLAQIASGVISLLMTPEFSGQLEKNLDLPKIMALLGDMIGVLSDNDEIEITGDIIIHAGPGNRNDPDQIVDPLAGSSLMPVLASLDRMKVPDEEAGNASTSGRQVEHIPDAGIVPPNPPKGNFSEMPASMRAYSAERRDTGEAYTVIVEIAKPANQDTISGKPAVKDIKIVESRIFNDPAVAQTAQATEPGDPKTATARIDRKEDDFGKADKIIIRIKETEDTQTSGNAPDSKNNENELVIHPDNLRQGTHQNDPEIKAVAKNDFGAIMIDKIEKLTEHFAGKNANIDMQVKLKVGENETILVSLRDDGSKINVEVRGTNENTLNYLQSQKDDLVKNLEARNITTAIHVDIDQDAQQRQRQKDRHEAKDTDGEDGRDFEAFFEAIA